MYTQTHIFLCFFSWRLKKLICFSIGQGPLEDHLDEVTQKPNGVATDLATPLVITPLENKRKKPWSVECKPSLFQKKRSMSSYSWSRRLNCNTRWCCSALCRLDRIITSYPKLHTFKAHLTQQNKSFQCELNIHGHYLLTAHCDIASRE